MGKARRKRGLIAIEAIRGIDMVELAERYNLSKSRVRKAIRAGLTANGIPADTRTAIREGLERLREAPEQAIEKIRRKAGLAGAGTRAAAKRPAKKASEAPAKPSRASASKKAAPSGKGEPKKKQVESEAELPTRLQNLLLDSPFASDGSIDRKKVAAASLEELQELPGCGKASAEAIKAWAGNG